MQRKFASWLIILLPARTPSVWVLPGGSRTGLARVLREARAMSGYLRQFRIFVEKYVENSVD